MISNILSPSLAATGTARRPRSRPASAQKGPVDAVSADTLSKVPAWAQRYFTHGNAVTPLVNEEAAPNDAHEIFAQVEKMLKGAEKSIQIEMFNIDKKSIVNLLIAEAKKGIKVQVIMDPPNEGWESARKGAIETLRKGGVDVQIYPAKEAGDPEAKFGQLDHVKMLLVDGKKAIIGGMNWGEHSPANHDYDVAIEGPAVEKMGWLFREDWIKSGGDSKQLPYIEKVGPKGDSMVNLIVSSTDEKERTIGKTIQRAIENAKRSVHAELFVLTDHKTIDALIAAKNRGVDVKVILNPLKIKENAINEKAAAQLRAAGVDVKWFRCNEKTQQKLHAKMAVFDDDQVIVGSANWSYAGFNTNREADVEVLSKDTAASFDKIFNKDWKSRTSDDPIYIDSPEDAGG
jgi:cardiolipin synthase